jgi:signal peptidase I
MQDGTAWWTRALWGRDPRRTLRRTALSAALLLFVFGLCCRPLLVRGHSMEPTLRDGQLRIGSRWWIHAQRNPARGDVVVIKRAGGRNFFVKRILALPGDTIAFSNGHLRINGDEVPEPYRTPDSDWTLPEQRMGPDQFFVAGDNRSMPMAEHAIGRVERAALAGRVLP